VPEFKERRRAQVALVRAALETPLLVQKPQRADAALVVDGQQEVQFAENAARSRRPCRS